MIKNCNTAFLCAIFNLCSILTFGQDDAFEPDNLGVRASWMKGAWGALWLPSNIQNGAIEGLEIDEFITQINDLRTIDYVQLPLTCPSIYSPTHAGPHDIIESLWEGDTDESGNIINLVVPRASEDDPLLRWLKALRAAGLRSEIYVNSYNLLARFPDDVQEDYPDVSDRWMEWCDTNTEAQTFINSQAYHVNGDNRRAYMFCYAEFILKEYAVRYGDLIDAWCFDSADNIMEDECGDEPASENLEHQRIYEAFANAVHAGNPNAAVSFNNSVGDRVENPFTTATYFDDYTFGHPFGGAGNMVENETLYTYNYHIIEWMQDYAGSAFLDDDRDWNDNVVSHFFPKQSTTSWAAGNTPCLTDEEFVEWTSNGIIDGGAITWGTPLIIRNLKNANPNLTLQEYALTQLTLTDNYLKEFQYSDAPSWARQYTILPIGTIGQLYSYSLIEGKDFWNSDEEHSLILSVIDSQQSNVTSWLSISESTTEPGVWNLTGTPPEGELSYTFKIRAQDNAGNASEREVTLELKEYDNSIVVKSVASTNYGIGNSAVFVSDVVTAIDGIATFKVSIEVTPPSDKAVISGISGGESTENSWGLGVGNSANTDDIFIGSDNEWVENISNIQIIDFKANGGLLTKEGISAYFTSITIVNAQSTNDNVSIIGDKETVVLGKLANKTSIVDLESEFGSNTISEFSVGVGNTSATNKWSIENIKLKTIFNNDNLSVAENIENSLKIFPNPTKDIIHFSKEVSAIEVYDMRGSLLLRNNSKSDTLNLSSIEAGVYSIKILFDTGSFIVKRIIKEN